MGFSLADLNWLAVIVAALVYFFIGSFWYSPVLFAEAWLKEIGKNKEELGMNPVYFILTFLFNFIASFALACILGIAHVDGLVPGLFAGLMAGIALGAAVALHFMYEGRSVKLYFITIGYHIAAFPLMGMILAFWK